MHRTSILILTPAPADRRSDVNLDQIAVDLASVPGVDVAFWYLRAEPHLERRPGSRAVDDLRRWRPAAFLSAIGAERAAGWLRGARLRKWLREVDPDVVVLDDGLGARVLDAARRPPKVAVRLNREATDQLHFEPEPSRTGDLVVLPVGGPPQLEESVAATQKVVHERSLTLEPWWSRDLIGPNVSRAFRERAGLPDAGRIVVGWGDDGWLDGPDVFVRTIWSMRRRGADVRGVWFGLDSDPHEAARLRAEAARCGLAEHFHLLPFGDGSDRLCGDVVFLPYRSPRADLEREIAPSVLTGAAVVTFPVGRERDPAVHFVPYLDVEAAADELLSLLESDAQVDPSDLGDDVCAALLELAGARR